MRKSILFFCLLLSGFLQLHAQRELLNPLIDSKEIIQNGVALNDSGKYKEAIAEYLKVPSSDTGYADVLHELILSYYNDSNFVEAEKYGNKALALYPEKSTDWYNLLANVYDDTHRSELALRAYDTILAQSPYSYITYFNKGISLLRQEKYDDAQVNFEKCVLLNPYYSSAHYFLGQLQLLKGNLVQAMLSFTTNLMVVPDNRYEKKSINQISSIAEINTAINDDLKNYKPSKEDNFGDIQDILVSKVALDGKYKLKADLEDPIVRQLQVVIEKLEYDARDKGFWMQYYVPLFKSLWDNNQFESMIFYAFSGVDIKKVKEYNQKEKKKIEVFSNAAAGYLNEIRESHELDYTKRADTKERYYIKDFLVSGKGAYGKNSKNEDVVTGPWEFYYPNGRLRSKGTFDNEGQRTGYWNYYYDNGQLKETSYYTNDMADGKSSVWFDNGVTYSKSTYHNDKKNGEETSYYFNGRIASVIYYKAGNKEGTARYYNVDGYLSSVINYNNGKQDGDAITYYPNGEKESLVRFTNDLPEGKYAEYFDNGKLKSEGNFSNGEKTGLWTTYFIDGTTAKTENYTKGKYDGENISYYTNGKIQARDLYSKGDIDGKSQNYDDDGIIFSETVYERGRLRDIKFFDKKGNVISNTTSRNGKATISFYDANGILESQGAYTKEGQADGKFTYYYKNGNVSAEANFNNGKLEGSKIYYYPNKKIKEELNYKDDKANGYLVDYYINGQVSAEGWYVNDQRQGTFINYDLLGNITSKIYYLNDEVHGVSEYYNPGNRPDNNEYFIDGGWFNKIEEFDSTGKIIATSTLDKGEGKVHFIHFNESLYFESNYKYYKLNGPYTVNNFDGSKASVSYYKNGKQDSVYTSWFANGNIHVEGHFKNGDKSGIWKYYYFNGTLSETENYKNGKLDGKIISYNEAGKEDREYSYKDGDMEGETKFYGDNGELIIVFYYKKDNILGYSYFDKTGKLVPMIPLEKGAGTVDSYYKNGVKSAHMIFNEGEVDGERILYYTNGKKLLTSYRINGLENGPLKIYYPDGKLMKEENFYYDSPNGSFKYYNEDGSLIYNINYNLGSLNGECKYYSPEKLAKTYVYYYGVLESIK